MHMRVVAAGLTALAALFAFAEPPNSCADPFWNHSLRCQAFPTQLPQLNAGSVPATVSDVKDFTRVFLTRNDATRCIDGTRPVLYVDKAICTKTAGCGSAAYGESIESDRWIISFTGGGSCNAVRNTATGQYDNADSCTTNYLDPTERDEMGSSVEPPMKGFAGINDPDPVRNPVFAGYNRVRVEKCSYDRYMVRVVYESPAGWFRAGTRNFNLYQQGFTIVDDALQTLAGGLTYTTWQKSGSSVVSRTESLPPLSSASTVLFVGHSGGAHGLMHNADRLAALLTQLGFRGEVRALFDANFLPSAENEAAFATTAPANSDAYSGITAGQSTASGVPFTY